nr:dipeptidyl-peptidase 5-like [Ipomoea batatas]
MNLSIQYWTSRGWALVDVNYGGSTGYGREFRERLLRNWGIVDVNDCCSCAKFLVDSGRVDGERLCITGSSAGGYTTLAALAFKDVFKAGCSLYGIGDLKLLVDGMPKFESHYIDNLVGDKNAYFERSPINFVDKFSCPIILFQGLDDKVVPPEQARKIYQALKAKGLPVALVEYEGEQHGFRKAENIKFTLEQQMVFFARLVGHFQVADPITPVKIDNFD